MSFFPLDSLLAGRIEGTRWTPVGMAPETRPGSRRAGGAGAVVTLLLLAPIVSEVLYGATRISVIFVLIPQIAIWGCGALLIREAVRRWRRGWVGLLLLGVALAVAEECIIQQTSLAPMVGLAGREYGRVLGRQLGLLPLALGYESVWVVVLPVRLAELIFPSRRDEPWVGRRGLILAGLAFLLGSFVAWYSWTQVARTQVFHMPEYRPPARVCPPRDRGDRAPGGGRLRPVDVAAGGRTRSGPVGPGSLAGGAGAFLFGLPWSVLVLLAYGAVPAVPFGIDPDRRRRLGRAVLFLFTRWTSSPTWDDRHRFAVVCGGVVACMAGGFVIFAVGGAMPVDWIGKAVLNVIAVLWLARLGRSLRREPQAAGKP